MLLFLVGIIIAISSCLLSLNLMRNFIRRFRPCLTDAHIELVRFTFIAIGLAISATIYFKSEIEKRDLIKFLHKSNKKISKLEERESLQRWAMLLPTGEEAVDVWGFKGTLAIVEDIEIFRRVFVKDGRKVEFAGIRCEVKNYIDDVKKLIEIYPKIPYPYVVLAHCLKRNGDGLWIKIAGQVKILLEDMMKFRPHVLTYESYYGFLMIEILELNIPKDSKFLKWQKNEKGSYYIPLIYTD
jgi:hypothetical protein